MGFTLGSKEPHAPTLMVVGGIHGLEKIGAEVTLAFQQHLIGRYAWDLSLQRDLQRIRLAFFPAVNPMGILNHTRCNPNGVDLMRNAPVESNEASHWVGGQTLSRHLPWYRGPGPYSVENLEPELRALHDFVLAYSSKSTFTLILDCHSGFGLQDQLWFPYAHTKKIYPEIRQIVALKQLLDESLPHHVYRFEPQSRHYCTHGDLWDYLLLNWGKDQTLIPLTLEMGSWTWLKKNPWQALSFQGPFNPIKPHRHRRILRRHLPLFQWLQNATLSHENWLHNLPKETQLQQWIQHWYQD